MSVIHIPYYNIDDLTNKQAFDTVSEIGYLGTDNTGGPYGESYYYCFTTNSNIFIEAGLVNPTDENVSILNNIFGTSYLHTHFIIYFKSNVSFEIRRLSHRNSNYTGSTYYNSVANSIRYNNLYLSHCVFEKVEYAPMSYTGIYNTNIFNTLDEFIANTSTYPITYNATNCTMSGPTEASGGTEVVVNVTPASGYILRSSGVSVIDSTGVTVPHIVQGNQIAFTMPYAP